jgi:hypothetical protein
MCTVRFIWLRAAVWVAGISLAAFLPQAPKSPASPRAVVVELFTSEGCSSCPPADALLGRLRQESTATNVEVIPLGLHVDYWNFQGWTDRFSSAAYSRRQQKYATKFGIEGPYTPQMVVDGVAEFVGSDAARAHQAIAQAALRPAVAEVQIKPLSVDKLLVTVHAPTAPAGDVMLALTEDNLQSKVSAGENGGKELRHSAVVRDLHALGQLHDGNFEAGIPLKIQRDWKRDDLRVVVFVQEPGGKITGAAALAGASLPRAR